MQSQQAASDLRRRWYMVGVLSSNEREIGELHFGDLIDSRLDFLYSREALLDQAFHRAAQNCQHDDGDDEQDLDLFAVVEHGHHSLKR